MLGQMFAYWHKPTFFMYSKQVSHADSNAEPHTQSKGLTVTFLLQTTVIFFFFFVQAINYVKSPF